VLQSVVIQDSVFDAVLKMQGPVTDDTKISDLLSETQANIDRHRSMLHELRYLQVRIALMLHCLPGNFSDSVVFCQQNVLCYVLDIHTVVVGIAANCT